MRIASFPRFQLVTGITPLQRAARLEAALGTGSPRIYIKRDDLTGLAYGGNKARKLEYLVADAIAQNATVLVTEGAVQSNHARMTAAAAVLAGLKSYLILDARNGQEEQGNLLLDRLMGAECGICATVEERIEARTAVPEMLRARGERPYVIPTGGSNALGSLGYIRAARELDAQLTEIGEDPSSVYFPSGSQGTLAGMVVGARVFGSVWNPVGVAVSGDSRGMLDGATTLIEQTLALIESDLRITVEDNIVDGNFAGEAYGIPTEAGLEACHLLARTEAIFLDPVYTGKAMSALIAHVRAGRFSPDESIVFIHTGGTPSIFVHRDMLLAGT